MKLTPIGTGSLLVAGQLHFLFTPRILRLGIARSRLAARLRRLAGQSSRERIACPTCPPDRLAAAPKPPETKPVDRTWPSDLKTDDIEQTTATNARPDFESSLGNALDTWL